VLRHIGYHRELAAKCQKYQGTCNCEGKISLARGKVSTHLRIFASKSLKSTRVAQAPGTASRVEQSIEWARDARGDSDFRSRRPSHSGRPERADHRDRDRDRERERESRAEANKVGPASRNHGFVGSREQPRTYCLLFIFNPEARARARTRERRLPHPEPRAKCAGLPLPPAPRP
jgi:hypothetical protein